MYLRLTPGGHDSAPIIHKDESSQNSVPQQNHDAATDIFCGAYCIIILYIHVNVVTCTTPVFCILQVFVKGVSGGTDSPSPIVTSSTNDMDGVLTLGLSKS